MRFFSHRSRWLVPFAVAICSIVGAPCADARTDARADDRSAALYKRALAEQTERARQAEAQQAERTKRVEALLEAQEAMHQRVEAMVTLQTETLQRQVMAMERYEKILAGWEKQQQQYQKYLDSLPK